MAHRSRRLAVKLLLALVALALALVLVDRLILRLDVFGISYYRDVNRYFNQAIRIVPEALNENGRLFENAPDRALSFVRFDWRTDGQGFRCGSPGTPFAVERPEPPERLRLLFLGDSVTLAWGVDDDVSWIRRLEREARAADDRPLECLNAGHLSYDTVQELDYLATHGATLRPDAVVLTYVSNDIESTWEQYEPVLRPGVGIQVPTPTWRERAFAWWVRNFQGVYGLWHLERELAAQPEPGGPAFSIQDEPRFALGWERSRAALEGLRQRCAELGVPFLVLDHTMPRIPELERWCAEAGVPCYPFWFTDEESALDIHNSKADAHANALGQELLAAKALAALRGIGLLAR